MISQSMFHDAQGVSWWIWSESRGLWVEGGWVAWAGLVQAVVKFRGQD